MFAMPMYMVFPVFFWVALFGSIGLAVDGESAAPMCFLVTAVIGFIWYLVIKKTNWYPRTARFLDRLAGKK
jgi:hypothetical protein